MSYHTCFQSTFICIFTFCVYITKYQKYITISIRSHFCKWPWRDWQPLCRVGCEFFVCLCMFVGLIEKPPNGLLSWFSKLREILTLHFAASPSPLRGKPTLAQDVARRISGAIAGEVFCPGDSRRDCWYLKRSRTRGPRDRGARPTGGCYVLSLRWFSSKRRGWCSKV